MCFTSTTSVVFFKLTADHVKELVRTIVHDKRVNLSPCECLTWISLTLSALEALGSLCRFHGPSHFYSHSQTSLQPCRLVFRMGHGRMVRSKHSE